jgi:hypothetical protein
MNCLGNEFNNYAHAAYVLAKGWGTIYLLKNSKFDKKKTKKPKPYS